ncbi:hypothetical protein MYCTH_2304845 [Thermothelomyces thermophilus ATCC 42464]|uniref:Pleckstrin homology domain-containing protein n=1 Tax=Thermothelomyces thermophilus (strain ATCC 42464 / BCRC 31852 / DSM 1799) TaxID=573729 RepID=G2QBM4_THET4|nr:uncharacterized protein MYCTH_2304845 [Thermothelomyces thermophilus ATCC 42464]AEO57967.1 hypothetical protein MYCTH_2304845 [Thermothelomyces thermophilus ATCC 42464]
MARRPSDAFSQYSGAPSDAPSGMAGRPRRMSMEEDMFYREVMTSRPAKPPSYESAMKAALAAQRRAQAAPANVADEVLPPYSCDINLEGVFMRKMEIEETTKRAEYRDWRMVYVELRGTALNIYSVKKERGWWPSSSKHDGPDISPDQPPWVKKSTLERAYSLLHADAGIAADYRKRRYVIRMRVETDQFLLSCVELGTFVTWLDGIFAAINVSPPIDERDFPRDFSVPRIQRIRWLRGQRPQPEDSIGFHRLTEQRRQDGSSEDEEGDRDGEVEDGEAQDLGYSRDEEGNAGYGPRTDHPIVGRLSTTSYPNENIDPETGKWRPQHVWSTTHDQLYARLCYSVLLFKSPRKSNYVISRGKRWYVDWETGRMVRVLPPAYGEVDVMGPWQVIMPENRLL